MTLRQFIPLRWRLGESQSRYLRFDFHRTVCEHKLCTTAFAQFGYTCRGSEIFFAVAENETEVIGFCNIGQTQQGVELFRIYMLPEFVGQGIGGFLLSKGEQYLRKQGFSSYFCFVHSVNEVGKRFYEKQGFHHVAERDHNDEWFMEKQLPELRK
jgi:ribosomal protein S18 acetylase RimI-like enzyme